jgi:hypothetical protein
LLDAARRRSARAVDTILTATYWEVGRRIVQHEQRGRVRAEYGTALLERLSRDLKATCGRGFSRQNLQQMRLFYLGWRVISTPSRPFQAVAIGPDQTETESPQICQTPSGEFTSGKNHAKSSLATVARKRQTPSGKSATPSTTVADPTVPVGAFPLSWSHYVRLLSVSDPNTRSFYEAEAIRGGWSVRQLDRQVSTLFYERTALPKRKAAMLEKGGVPKPEDAVSTRDEIRDPYLPMSKLPGKPWHQVVQLRPDIRTGKLSLSEFAADLHDVVMDSGARSIAPPKSSSR